MNLRLISHIAISALLVSWGAWSQEYRATLQGRVVDPGGAATAGAQVSAVETSTGVSLSTSTNQEGDYTIPYLQPGTYRVRVEAQGFKAFARNSIELRVASRVRVDVQLELGALTETINVTAAAPLLDEASASTAQTIDSKRLTELPIAKGVAYHMIALAPGVNFARANRVEDNPWDWSITAHVVGGSKDYSTITIDGGVTGGTIGSVPQPSFSPPSETIGELRVQTTSFDASQGFTQAANLNFSLKSGTSTPHGAFYYQKSDPALAANTYLNALRGLPKGDFNYSRTGGALGGPVIIPKVYNGKNKTFFFVGPEWIRQTTMFARTYTVPTLKERTGDFSDLLRVGSVYQVYDPSTRRSASGGRFTSDPFPGNIVPRARISPIATNMLNYYAEPNAPGTADGTNNFVSPVDGKYEKYWSIVGRIDHNISDRHRIYVSTHASRRLVDDVWLPRIGQTWDVNSRGGAFDDVYTFGPTFIMNARIGYERFLRDVDYLEGEREWSYAANGWPAAMDALTDPTIRRRPGFNPEGYSGMPLFTSGLQTNTSDVYSPAVSFTKTSGVHTLKFGVESRIYRENNNAPLTVSSGTFSFNSTYTRGPLDNSPGAPKGQGLASAMLGIATGGNLDRRTSSADQSVSWGIHFQDDWRVTPRLTLNLGLRYEYEGPTTERFNRSISDFDYSAVLPISAQAQANYALNPTPEVPASQFLVRGGLRFAGVGGQSRQMWRGDRNNFMPRFGFAYSLNSKTVLRGGYGVFFSVGGIRLGNANQTGFNQSTPIVPSLDGGLTFAATLANPFPSGVTNPTGSSLGTMTFAGQNISFFNPRPTTSYLQRWQWGFQRELPARVVLDASYAGSRGNAVVTSRDLNAIPVQHLSTSPVRDTDRINYLSANLANPFYPLLPSTGLASTVVARTRLLQPIPQFGTITSSTNEGYTWYHALQVRFERRFSHGITASSSYTWSKFMEASTFLNAGDPHPERVISALDFPHNFSMSGIFELPFGRGRRMLANVPRGVNAIIGGWQIDTVFRYQSGPALGFGNAIFNGNLKDIPLPAGERTVARWFNVDAGFDRAAARQLSMNRVAFSSRFGGVRADSLNQWDLSALKKFMLREAMWFELRADFLNAFNQAWLGGPNTTPSSTAFGSITEVGNPRIVHLSLRFKF